MALEPRSETRKNRLEVQAFEFDFASEVQTPDDLTIQEKKDIEDFYDKSEKTTRHENIDDLLDDLES
jgi:hypothetical protein